jgi:hypothetical protein
MSRPFVSSQAVSGTKYAFKSVLNPQVSTLKSAFPLRILCASLRILRFNGKGNQKKILPAVVGRTNFLSGLDL